MAEIKSDYDGLANYRLTKNKSIGIILAKCSPSCGVPQYSKDLSINLNSPILTSTDQLRKSVNLKYLIFQCCMDTYYGEFHDLEYFEEINEICKEKRIYLLTMLHNVPYYEKMQSHHITFLKKVNRYSKYTIVHSQLAKSQLDKLGLSSICVIPHGCIKYKAISYSESKKRKKQLTIASFGSMRHEKGFLQILRAAKKLNAKFILLSRVDKGNRIALEEYKKIQDESFDCDLELNTDSLKIEEVINRLKESDVIVFAYPEETSYIATSGAIRQALSIGKPVLCTDAPRFSDLNGEVYRINDTVESIVEGIKTVCSDKKICAQMRKETMKTFEKYSWVNISKKYVELVESIVTLVLEKKNGE
jgi:glycosyltransferase involved in cell wall biosynthesis